MEESIVPKERESHWPPLGWRWPVTCRIWTHNGSDDRIVIQWYIYIRRYQCVWIDENIFFSGTWFQGFVKNLLNYMYIPVDISPTRIPWVYDWRLLSTLWYPWQLSTNENDSNIQCSLLQLLDFLYPSWIHIYL